MIRDIFSNKQPKPGYVYHYRPFSLYRNREMEEYLNYMSNNGRILTEISRGVHQKFIFKITEPEDLTYRFVLSNKKELDQEMIKSLEYSGWEYICSENPLARKQSFHVFSSAKEDANNKIFDEINKEAADKFRFRSILSSGIPWGVLILAIMHILLLGTTHPGIYAGVDLSKKMIIGAEVIRYIYLLKPEWEFYIRHKKEGKYQDIWDWRKLSKLYKRDMGILSMPIMFQPVDLLIRVARWY
jgi:hypothetical protein